jgi:hypothetical protein
LSVLEEIIKPIFPALLQNLKTRDLGRLVIYTEVITTVMNVLNGHPMKHGLVVIARRQTSGRGASASHFTMLRP